MPSSINLPPREREVLRLVRQQGLLRPRDLIERNIPTIYLHRLMTKGVLERVARGLYRLPDAEVTEHRSFVEIAKKYPNAVVCLLSALQFHGFTTQMPRETWLAIDTKARTPQAAPTRIRVIRLSGASFKEGIRTLRLERVLVKIYNPAKTVADCFKFRNKIGLDVALEALRECLRSKLATVDDLWRYARICRVEKIMKPYLQTLV